jgi:addiction module RelE/StbE family toxin
MYEFYVANSRAEKKLHEIIAQRNDVKDKLDRLKIDPRREAGAHPLHGRLKGKWSCWLGSDIRVIYSIHDETKQILIEAVGSHKIY